MSKGKPIFSFETEQAVLGALLIDESSFSKVSSDICAKDFYHSKHALIYGEIEKLSSDGLGVDQIRVGASLDEAGILDDIGGQAYLGDLEMMVPSSDNVSGYAKDLARLSERRKVLAASLDLAELLKESDDPFSTISEFNLSLEGMRSNKEAGSLYSKAVRDSKSILELAEPDYWIDDFLPKDTFVSYQNIEELSYKINKYNISTFIVWLSFK